MTSPLERADGEQFRREAALLSMARFAHQHKVTNCEWEEVRHPDRIDFIGTTDDGRKFGVGYLIDAALSEGG